MEIEIKVTRVFAEGDCVICKHGSVCKIFEALRGFPLAEKLKFDCPHADLEEE